MKLEITSTLKYNIFSPATSADDHNHCLEMAQTILSAISFQIIRTEINK